MGISFHEIAIVQRWNGGAIRNLMQKANVHKSPTSVQPETGRRDRWLQMET